MAHSARSVEAIVLRRAELRRQRLGEEPCPQPFLVPRKPEQGLVLQAKQRAAQHAGEAHLVVRAGQGPQQVQQVEDFLLGVEGMSADQVILDAVAPQGFFVEGHVRQRAKEDRDVARPHRADPRPAALRPRRVGDDLLARVEQAANPAGDPLGLASPQPLLPAGTGRGLFAGIHRPQQLDRRQRAGLRAIRLERLVVRAEVVAEQGVDEIQDRRLAAEVQRQRQPAALGGCFLEAAKDVRIGAAEAVDRLLVVPHEKQLPLHHLAAAEGFHQLDLERVGVLEFVDQQQPHVVGQPALEVPAVRARQ
jgi:hypothetical protein